MEKVACYWSEFFCPDFKRGDSKKQKYPCLYAKNDKRWFNLQNIVLKANSEIIELTNICLLVENKNEVIRSKHLVIKVIDAVTMLDRESHQMTIEQKGRSKNLFSEDYRICEYL